MKDLTLYCNCYPEHENQHTQYMQKNLMCGSSKISEEYRRELLKKNFYFDDNGYNISEMNDYLGDLTGLYYIWKNTSEGIIGTNQYRRWWLEEEVDTLKFDERTFYVSAPFNFNTSTYEQFVDSHGQMMMNVLAEAARHRKICLTVDDVDNLHKINVLSSCNMFFSHRDIFNKLCELHFETMFEIYNGVKYALPFIQDDNPWQVNQPRTLAFLSERILTLMYLNIGKYIPGTKVESVSWINNGTLIKK